MRFGKAEKLLIFGMTVGYLAGCAVVAVFQRDLFYPG